MQNKNKNILIIGSSTPLQKLLPYFYKETKINIVAVFLDVEKDLKSKEFCYKNTIPYYSIKKLDDNILSNNVDWLFNINSTIILKDKILKIPSIGSLNFHPGILPQYAGLHTHQWAIRNNESTFGVTIHWMEAGIDTGNIAFQSVFKLTGKETGIGLYLKCLKEGEDLIKKTIKYIVENKKIPSIKQDLSKRKLYTNKMAKDGKVVWKQKGIDILNFFRASNYKPFESPTYKPYIMLDGVYMYIKKIDIDNNSINKLEIANIRLDNNKIIVGAIDCNIIIDIYFNDIIKNLKELKEFVKKSSKILK